jgi:hypothetical protein
MRSAIYDPIFSSIPLPLLSSVAHCSLLLLLLLLLLFLSLLTYLLTYSLTANTSTLSLSLSLSPFFTYFGCCFLWLLPHPACWFVVVVVVGGGGGRTPCLVPHNTTNKQQAQTPFHLLPLDSHLIQFAD